MPMNLESFIPCPATVDACTTGKEIGENACCPQQLDPKIITAGASYEVTFDWTATGPLFAIIPNTAQWKLEVMMETLGGNPDPNPITVTALKQHVPAAGPTVYQEKVVLAGTNFTAGQVLRPIFKLTLFYNSVLIVCAFSDGDLIHITENY